MKKYFEEFIGTMIFVLLSCGISATTNTIFGISGTIPGSLSLLTIALGVGLSYYVVSYIFKGTFNPIFILTDYLNKNIKFLELFKVLLIQFIGSYAGVLILGIILGPYGALGANGYLELSIIGANIYQMMAVEIIATIILTLVYLIEKNNKVISLALSTLYLFTIPYTNGALNPAKSLGAALTIGEKYLMQVGWFILASLIGTVLGYIIFKVKKNDN